MTKLVVVLLALAALVASNAFATAQDKADQDKSQVFVNGSLSVPGAPADTDTTPSKYSPRNAASDQLPIAAFRLKHLTDDQRREIYQQLTAGRGALALSPGGGEEPLAIVGAEIAAEIALRDLAPVPDAVAAKFPALRDAAFLRSDGKLLLVAPTNRIVIGVLPRQ